MTCEKHNIEKTPSGRKLSRLRCRTCSAERAAKQYLRDPRITMLCGARQRAAAAGVPFTITKNDIVIPKFCPVFGVKLEKGTKGNNPNAPSLDRVVPSLGYVAGNIVVVSQRANVLKRDGTLAEFNRLVAWLNAREFDSAWNTAETRRALA